MKERDGQLAGKSEHQTCQSGSLCSFSQEEQLERSREGEVTIPESFC